MDSDRVIGRVLNVDSFRVTVEVDKDTKSLTKAHYTGICPVARINSYIIIPVGFEKIVGHVTRVQMFSEATEVQNRATIALPDVKRLVWATMIGTIKKAGESEAYEQGITAFPSLDNPVWFVLKEELDCIFDKSTGFDEDALRTGGGRRYYVPIGKSTAFPDYEVKIDPDAIFSKHLAVLGNTGSGKSCTIASLIQTILRTDFGGRKVSNAHIVIFDTNGEYSSAFTRDGSKPAVGNALLVGRDGLRIPYWFMNFDDFVNVFRPGEGAQLPVLSNALLYARNRTALADDPVDAIQSVLDAARSHYRNLVKGEIPPDPNEKVKYVMEKEKRWDSIKQAVSEYVTGAQTSCPEVTLPLDVDTPSHFDREKLLDDYVQLAIDESAKSNSKIRDYCSTMLMRMRKYFQDPRYDFVFHNYPEAIDAALATFLRLVLGRMGNVTHNPNTPTATDEHFVLKEYFRQTEGQKANHQVVIIDFSLVASDVLENVTALIARLMLEFLQLMGEDKTLRGEFPVVLVLEEAHNYVPERRNPQDPDSISKVVFERIAREGRKFGLSLVVSSQRPSELSRTVLSQCNSFIVHRIQNPEDQRYIQTIIPSINEDLLKQLPSLAQRTALVFGDCVRAPAQIVMNEARPLPDSKDPRFMRHWLRLDAKAPEEPKFEGICKTWERAGDTTGSPPAEVSHREPKDAS
jgi:DNA helicase HerA-like ATPase